eukprot:TRINITY_DN5544_c2_g1_i1.p3 TRINITY_DN5544_c2_g1~~TRINITY_DN5544_c2_g1_i1.p3  ORF type:complete len:184 (-),score=3.10 TRINITY_DN5544_c2_g1_i1:108-659(-)
MLKNTQKYIKTVVKENNSQKINKTDNLKVVLLRYMYLQQYLCSQYPPKKPPKNKNLLNTYKVSSTKIQKNNFLNVSIQIQGGDIFTNNRSFTVHISFTSTVRIQSYYVYNKASQQLNKESGVLTLKFSKVWQQIFKAIRNSEENFQNRCLIKRTVPDQSNSKLQVSRTVKMYRSIGLETYLIT